MKLQYLGTAAAEAWPALFCDCESCREAARRGGKNLRRRSGAMINDNILIDLSADLYYAKMALNLDLSKVRHVLITHAHEDHFYPENLAMYQPGFAHIPGNPVLNVYGSDYTHRAYTENFNLRDGMEGLGKSIQFHVLKPFEAFSLGHLRITPLPGCHGCPETLIYLIEDGKEEWLYAHDTGIWGEDIWTLLKQHHLSFVSLDCTNGPLPSTYYGHMGFDMNLVVRERMLAEKIADGSTRFICNHFSHNGAMLHEEMEAKMNPLGFEISYDGMVLQGK